MANACLCLNKLVCNAEKDATWKAAALLKQPVGLDSCLPRHKGQKKNLSAIRCEQMIGG